MRVRQAVADSTSANTRRASSQAFAFSTVVGRRRLDLGEHAPGLRRAYAGALRRFADSLAARADRGASPATLSQDYAAIGAAGRDSRTGDPRGPVSKATLRGVRRQASQAGQQPGRGQVAAMGWQAVVEAAALAAAERSPAGLKDAAILRVMSDAFLRVSEAAALDWADVQQEADGSGRLTVRCSKTDQEAEGAVLFLGAPSMRAVRKWKAASVAESPLFRRVWGRSNTVGSTALSPNTVRRVLHQRAKAAGVESRISGHSACVGSAQDLAAAGAELTELMDAGRWQSPHARPLRRGPACRTRGRRQSPLRGRAGFAGNNHAAVSGRSGGL